MLVAAALSLVIGVLLGMLGGGGAILTLPMLVYVADVEPKTAIAMSLFVVGSTSLVGAAINARARTVEWKIGLVFGAAAMAGAFAGGRLASLISATILLVVFAVMMLVTATAMLQPRRAKPSSSERRSIGLVVALGAGVGVVSGLVGAGGGFLIVPALTIFGGLPMRRAIGTSLFVIALQSFAGFAGHANHVSLDGSLLALVTVPAVVGTVVGVSVGKKVPADVLRRGFAWLVVAMGLFVIGKQASVVVTALVAAVTLAAIYVVTRKRPANVQKDPWIPSPQSPR